jgi:hypothetical protein
MVNSVLFSISNLSFSFFSLMQKPDERADLSRLIIDQFIVKKSEISYDLKFIQKIIKELIIEQIPKLKFKKIDN